MKDYILLGTAAALAVTAALTWSGDLFPRCACCGKRKPAFMFRVLEKHHRSAFPIGRGDACRTCGRKYSIETVSQCKRIYLARKLAEHMEFPRSFSSIAPKELPAHMARTVLKAV